VQGEITIRVVSPPDGAYVSGAITLRAEITPSSAIPRVREVTFWVDGQVVCRRESAPFACEWDAGRTVNAHTIRAVATLDSGRTTHTVRTRKLEFSEVVDVEAVQVITVVTDEAGRFVGDCRARRSACSKTFGRRRSRTSRPRTSRSSW
jgi:hypothetical protein